MTRTLESHSCSLSYTLFHCNFLGVWVLSTLILLLLMVFSINFGSTGKMFHQMEQQTNNKIQLPLMCVTIIVKRKRRKVSVFKWIIPNAKFLWSRQSDSSCSQGIQSHPSPLSPGSQSPRARKANKAAAVDHQRQLCLWVCCVCKCGDDGLISLFDHWFRISIRL